jgi:hypothetical protein
MSITRPNTCLARSFFRLEACAINRKLVISRLLLFLPAFNGCPAVPDRIAEAVVRRPAEEHDGAGFGGCAAETGTYLAVALLTKLRGVLV